VLAIGVGTGSQCKHWERGEMNMGLFSQKDKKERKMLSELGSTQEWEKFTAEPEEGPIAMRPTIPLKIK